MDGREIKDKELMEIEEEQEAAKERMEMEAEKKVGHQKMATKQDWQGIDEIWKRRRRHRKIWNEEEKVTKRVFERGLQVESGGADRDEHRTP